MSKEDRFSKIDDEILRLAEMEPHEIIIKKRKYLKDIGFEEALGWKDSSMRHDFRPYIDRIGIFGVPDCKKPMQDPVLFAVIVASLRQYHNEAVSFLVSWGRYDYIYSFSDYIKTELQKRRHYSTKLYFLCKFSESEKDSLLKTGLRMDEKAVLGDSAAINHFINRFKKRKFDKEIIDLLAYIGAEQTLRALVRGLGYSDYIETNAARESIRLPILLALSRAFPNEPLFQEIPYKLRSVFDHDIPEETFVRYANDLKKWAWDNFEVKLNFDEESFYISIYLGDIYPDFVPYMYR